MTERERTRGEDRFWSLAEPLLAQAGVTRSTMMGFPCLRLAGNFFASCDHRSGDLVIKLDAQRVATLIEQGIAEPFAPNGRRFREWATVPVRKQRSWARFLDEAMQFAAAASRAPAPRQASTRELGRVRTIALALPEVNERLSHGEPCFFVRGERPLCYFHDNHNGDGRVSLWCPAPPGVQEALVAAEPERFFAPPTSARGTFADWLGVYLDAAGSDRVDWKEIAAIVEDAYRLVAPRELVAKRNEGPKAAPS